MTEKQAEAQGLENTFISRYAGPEPIKAAAKAMRKAGRRAVVVYANHQWTVYAAPEPAATQPH